SGTSPFVLGSSNASRSRNEAPWSTTRTSSAVPSPFRSAAATSGCPSPSKSPFTLVSESAHEVPEGLSVVVDVLLGDGVGPATGCQLGSESFHVPIVRRSCPVPSAFIRNRWVAPPSTRSNTTFVPSGDHAAPPLPPSPVNAVSPDPSVRITYTSLVGCRSPVGGKDRVNTSLVPSGD